MNTPRSNSEDRWNGLVRRARRDAAPPVDTAALLAAVRRAAAEPRPGWLGDFTALFAARRPLAACLASAAALAVLAGWQASVFWHDMAWAQMVNAAIGGAP